MPDAPRQQSRLRGYAGVSRSAGFAPPRDVRSRRAGGSPQRRRQPGIRPRLSHRASRMLAKAFAGEQLPAVLTCHPAAS